MKRIPLIALIAFSLVPALEAGSWLKSLSAAQAAAKKNGQLILIDMFAEWCGWCHRMEREVFPSEKFQNATKNTVLLRLDTEDRGEGTRLARDFGVRSLPTFLLLTHDLKIAGIIRGYLPATEFSNAVVETERKYVAFQKTIKNESAIARDYPKRLQLAKEMAERLSYADAENRFGKLIKEKGVPKTISDQALYQLATLQFNQKRYPESELNLKKLLAQKPVGESAELGRLMLGNLYVQLGNLKAAIAEFKTFKSSFPQSAYTRQIDMMLPQLETAARKK